MNDIIIIGAGPIGIYSATLASLHNLKGLVIETLDNVGGQLTSLYPEKEIIDIPGFNNITAREFIKKLLDQQKNKDNSLPIHLEEEFISYEKKGNYFEVITNKNTYQTKTILLTTGMGKFSPRKLDLDQGDYQNILYSIKDLSSFKNKNIVILGGGDSAVDWANALSKNNNVSIVHRRDEFRAKQDSVNQLANNNVNILKPFNVNKLISDNSIITSIELTSKLETKTIPLDYLLVNYGLITSQNKIDLETKLNAYVVNTFMQTSQEFIFAIGDCCIYSGKVKNITSGLGEAVTAITKIDQIINPNKNIPTHF